MEFNEQIDDYHKKFKENAPRKEVLSNLDLFVLDNSLRETTVGAFRGHTVADKWKIYNEVKKVGFKHILVEAFHRMNRLGEPFLRELIARGEDMSKLFAFTEFVDIISDDGVPQDDIPIGLKKMKEFGVNNPMLELDLAYYGIDYDKFNEERICALLSDRFKWIRENLSEDSLIFVNIRDIPKCFETNPRRLFSVINYISSLPEDERVFGIAYEEMGSALPEDMSVWTACVRREMDRCGWTSGHFILHVHEQFGLCDQVVLDCLDNGATGIWAAICEEGASMGHASSCLTIVNLIRMGNKKVLEKFNCPYLRRAAKAITEITTGSPPHPKQPVVGERALDVVFTLDQVTKARMDFCLADFVGEKYELRMSTLASPEMVVEKLKRYFGEDGNFTEEIAQRMLEVMLEDLHAGRKEEYHSAVGLAVLFDRSGGKLTTAISDVIDKVKPDSHRMQQHIDDIRKVWDQWDLRDGVLDDELDYFSFYNAFMIPYFGSYTCEKTRMALQAIDMDKDGKVDWKEFALYLKWAANEYPETETAEELLTIAFRKGILPAMMDEVVKDLQAISSEEDKENEIIGTGVHGLSGNFYSLYTSGSISSHISLRMKNKPRHGLVKYPK